MSQQFVALVSYRSNKNASFSHMTAATQEQARDQVKAMMEASVDIAAITLFESTAHASKVEIVQWN